MHDIVTNDYSIFAYSMEEIPPDQADMLKLWK